MPQSNETDPQVRLPEVRLSRTFHASRATVFRAWTSTDHVKAWFCPAGYTVPSARVEGRVGGPFEVCMRAADGAEHWSRGRFVEVEPDRRLVIEMDVLGQDGAALFTARTVATFTDDRVECRLDVVHTYTVHDARALPMVGGAHEGWTQTLDRLDTEIRRMQGLASQGRSVAHGVFSLERLYEASPARVWKALTDERAKAKWFGTPGKWTLIERTMDVRVGGRERLKARWESGMVTCFDATYFDVIDQHRLVYAYEMRLDEVKISVSLATMQIKAEGAKTRLMVTEQGAFLDGYDDAGSREHGTGLLLDALGASLAN